MSPRWPLTVCAAVAVLAPGLVHPALAEAGDPATGWWSRTKLGTPLEPPDTVPEGGMQVAAGPNGRLAVSALRAELPPDMRASALTLDVAQSRGTVAVTVCAVAAAWTPVDGGRLEDAPPEDCTLPAQGAVEDGKLLVTLDPASPAGPLDVVLLPTEGAAFTLDLQKPTAAAVTAEPVMTETALPDPTGSDGFGSTSPDGGFGSVGSPPFGGGELPAPLDLGTAAAPFMAGELPTLPGSTTAAPDAPVVAGPPPAAFQSVPLAAEPFDPREHSVPAALLLGVLIAFVMKLQSEPPRAPRALGGAARVRATRGPADDVAVPPEPARGVGRLQRTRPERPERI